MPIIEINGVRLNYRELGSCDKRAIVFAHTALFDSYVFDPLVSELVNDFHLILLDIHGHGGSGYRTPLTLEEMTADYDHLLAKLNLRNVIWIGHSIGGMVGMRLALVQPEAIDSLILIATTGRRDPPQVREQAWPLWEMFRAGHREDIVDVAFQLIFAPATFKNHPQLIERYRYQVTNIQDAEGIFQSVSAVFNRTDISDQIGAIKVPALVIAGREDLVTSPGESEVIASRIPNARLAIIDDASHMVLVEKPQEVSQIVREFLKVKRAGGEGSGR